MTGAIKTLGEAAPQEFQGYGAVIKSTTPTAPYARLANPEE